MSEIYSVTEVAKLTGFSEQYIRRLLQSNQISGKQVGKTWVIPSCSLAEIKQLKENNRKHPYSDRCSSVPINPQSIKCLSFFSGAMGLDLGLEQAGITTLLTSEIDKACRQTITENKPAVGLIGDIRDYSESTILKMAGLTPRDEIDVIVGGPPCQAFSTAGKRKGFDDERGNVFLYFIDLILSLTPKFVVIENVRGLLSAPLQHRPHIERGLGTHPLTDKELKGGALLHILEKLRAGGYSVSFNLYNAANFGAPQTRERVVILCSRGSRKMPYLEPTHSEDGRFGLAPWRTVKDALCGLGSEHHFVKFPEKRLKYYRMLKSGQNWRNLPENLQKEALGNSYFAGGGKTGFLRRLAWDKPSPTLVTHPAMPATDLAHPVEDRPLSIEEYKRLQEFPDEWEIGGSLLEQYRQIGNAVPISLGRAIGKTIIDYIENKQVSVKNEFKYSRYQRTDEISWENDVLSLRDKRNKAEQLTLLH